MANKDGFVLSIEGKVISKQINGIAKRATNLERDVHVCAVNCVGHAIKHGDYTLLSNLVNVIGVLRTNAVKAWAEKHAAAKWNAGKDDKPGQFTKNAEAFEPLAAEGSDKVMARLAKINPFVENKEPELHGLDIPAVIARSIKTAEEMQKKAAAGDKQAAEKLAKSDLRGLAFLKQVKIGDVEKAA
jgi:hypothetical protein